MKRLLVLALSIMMTLSLFISCQNQPNSNGVASVRLTPQAAKRSLTATVENIEEGSLEWHYSATKKSETSFKYGETADTKLAQKDSVIELSQGKWEFKLWAVKSDDSNASIKIYEGSSDGDVLVQSATEPTVVPIDVYSEVEGSTGYIYFDKSLKVTLRDTGSTTVVSPTHVGYKAASAEESTWSTQAFSASDGVKISSLDAGKYDITVYYAGNDGCTYASEAKTITVMSGRTTTIAGTIDESTANAKFDVKIIKKVVSATINTNSATTITATASPVTTKDSITSVEFPSSSISGTTATLTMEVAQVGSNFEISGTTESNAQSLAKLDLSLDVDGKSVTEFSGNEAVTVTTYIAKGLTNVSVKYTGSEDKQPTDVSYESSTGKLTFKTTHFSEFVVTTTDSFVAYNKSTNKGYASLAVAISEADEDDAILLLKDAEESSLSEVKEKKVSVNLNGKRLSLSNSLAINESSIAFSNGKISSTASSYGIILKSNSTLTLENNVEYVATARAIRINEHSKTSYLNITDSTVKTTGDAFAIQTDATKEESSDVNVTIKNSVIEAGQNSTKEEETDDSTGFMFNVSGKVVIENSEISGRRQGAIFRGGEYTVKNSTFKSTGTMTNYYNSNDYVNGNWKSGNEVPLAALVVGNRTTPGVYPYPTKVTLNNVTLETTNESEVRKSIYVYQTEGYPVTVTGDVKADWSNNDDMNGAYYPAVKVGNSYYDDLQSAINNASTGATVDVLRSIDLEMAKLGKGPAVKICCSITLNGNGHKLYNNDAVTVDDARLVQIDEKSGNVTIKNISIESSTYGTYFRGIQVNNNGTTILDNVNVKLPHYYAINIYADNNKYAKLEIKNSTIQGWSTIQSWTDGFTIEASGSMFVTINPETTGGNNNSFAGVVINKDANNNNLTFTGCTFDASRILTGNTKQYIVDLRSSYDTVTLTNCTLNPITSEETFRVEQATNYTITIDGTEWTEN